MKKSYEKRRKARLRRRSRERAGRNAQVRKAEEFFEFLEATEPIAADFAEFIGCDPPQIVLDVPEPWCEIAYCHANAICKAHRAGGRAVWGWHFTLNYVTAQIVAVFHAVWEPEPGALLDITPQSERVMKGRKAGLFVHLPWFCIDPRFFQRAEVEELENGVLAFKVTEQNFHERQGVFAPLERFSLEGGDAA
jgi:hypothetical protein